MNFTTLAVASALSIAPAAAQILDGAGGGSIATTTKLGFGAKGAKGVKESLGVNKISKGSKPGVTPPPPRSPVEGLISAWVQYTDGDGEKCPLGVSSDDLDPSCFFNAEVRAIIDDPDMTMTACPSGKLLVNEEPLEMTMRIGATQYFRNIVCYAKLPLGETTVESIALGNETLPIPKRDPRTMVFFGDSGCRMGPSHGGLYQSCNNPSLWPYDRVCRSVAASNPDVAIHTGDFVYREGPCPEGIAGCEGSPYYYTDTSSPEYKHQNFDVWHADFFLPSRHVFKATPVVLVRGNHETCKRAGEGYFRYLQPNNVTECNTPPFGDGTQPWLVDFDSFQIGIMDSSTPPQYWHPTNYMEEVGAYARQMDALAATATKPSILLTHFAIYGWGASDSDVTGEDGPRWVSPGMGDAAAATTAGRVPPEFGMLLGAHIHLTQVTTFADGITPPQVVVANGGTQFVAETDPPRFIGNTESGDYAYGNSSSTVSMEIENTLPLWQFGFVFLEKRGGGKWTMDFNDRRGRTMEPCSMNLAERDVTCYGFANTAAQDQGRGRYENNFGHTIGAVY